jgi:CPA1 family monovalent cation:H+ antiporter
VSWIGPLLIPSATRLQGIFFWDLIVYLIEGLVFLLTGLQARTLIDNGHAFLFSELAVTTAVVTAIAMAARFIWVFPATYIPRWVSASLASRDPLPPWQTVFFLAFTGVRGVDSLAVALAIPYTILSGAPFPHRDLILFVTFGVIIVTLIGQGALLPSLTHWLGLNRVAKKEHQDEIKSELRARQAALKQIAKRLEKLIRRHVVSGDAADHLRTRNRIRQQVLPENLTDGIEHLRQTARIKSELIKAEREFIYQLLRDGKITDEVRRRIEYELDLEEASVANRAQDGGGWF